MGGSECVTKATCLCNTAEYLLKQNYVRSCTQFVFVFFHCRLKLIIKLLAEAHCTKQQAVRYIRCFLFCGPSTQVSDLNTPLPCCDGTLTFIRHIPGARLSNHTTFITTQGFSGWQLSNVSWIALLCFMAPLPMLATDNTNTKAVLSVHHGWFIKETQQDIVWGREKKEDNGK